jgi:cell division protein FtsN
MARNRVYRWNYSGKKSNAFSFLFWLLVWSATSLAITMAIYMVSPTPALNDLELERNRSDFVYIDKGIQYSVNNARNEVFARIPKSRVVADNKTASKPRHPPLKWEIKKTPTNKTRPAAPVVAKKAVVKKTIAKKPVKKLAKKDRARTTPKTNPVIKKPVSKKVNVAKLESKKLRTRKIAPINVQPASGGSKLMIQAGSFTKMSSARTQQSRLAKIKIKSFIQSADVKGKKIFRVYVGPFETGKARQVKKHIEANNIKVFLRRRF